MSLPETIAIESHVAEYLDPVSAVRARFRVDGSSSSGSFPEGDWLHVVVKARVYSHEDVEAKGYVPDMPVAEGPEVAATARTEWGFVDLPLPSVRYGRYAVVAKVYSADDRYRKSFRPSNCYASRVIFGFRFVRMRLEDLQAVYRGVGNPVAENEIREMVRTGLIVAEDEKGVEYAASEREGQLALEPRRP